MLGLRARNYLARIYIHFVPNLSSEALRPFITINPRAARSSYIVTFWRDKGCYYEIIPDNANHISINPLRFRFCDLFLLYVKLQRLSLRIVFSWLYMSDFIASTLWLLSFSKFKLFGIFEISSLIVINIHYFQSLLPYIRNIFNKIPSAVACNLLFLEQHLQLGYPKSNSVVIYNGYKDYSTTANSNLQLPTNGFNISCVARLHPQKNHRFLFESLSLCLDIPFKIHFVGLHMSYSNSSLVSTLDKYIKGRYHLYGVRNQPFVHDLFALSDLSILASKYGEAFPNVVAESMLQGCYPICFDVGDARKIVGEHGSCIPLETSQYEFSCLLRHLDHEMKEKPLPWTLQRSKRSEYAHSNFSLTSSAEAFSLL